jgi:hypothetical protein
MLLSTVLLSAQAADGITRLNSVSTLKANEANQDALQGADKQRDLVNKQKQLRTQQNNFESVKPNSNTGNPMLQQQLRLGLMPANELKPQMLKLNSLLQDMNQSPRDPASRKKHIGPIKAQLVQLQGISQRLITGFDNVEKYGSTKGGKQDAEALKKKFEDMTKDLESKDKMDNFEIQSLMSDYNQAETLASSVQKKADDTNNSVIGKI